MVTGWMRDYQVVALRGVAEEDEATLNQYGLIGYELVAVTTVAGTGGLLAYLERGTPRRTRKRKGPDGRPPPQESSDAAVDREGGAGDRQ
jgi:hypothetical protein